MIIAIKYSFGSSSGNGHTGEKHNVYRFISSQLLGSLSRNCIFYLERFNEKQIAIILTDISLLIERRSKMSNHIRTFHEYTADDSNLVHQFENEPDKSEVNLVILIDKFKNKHYVDPCHNLEFDYHDRQTNEPIKNDKGQILYHIYAIEGTCCLYGGYINWKDIDGGTAYIAYRKPAATFNPDAFYTVDLPHTQKRNGTSFSIVCGDCMPELIEVVMEIKACGEFGECSECGHVHMRGIDDRLDISGVDQKTAVNLHAAKLKDDRYHDCIKFGAGRMIALGLENWVYATQWGSGSTVWRSPDNELGGHISIDDGIFYR